MFRVTKARWGNNNSDKIFPYNFLFSWLKRKIHHFGSHRVRDVMRQHFSLFFYFSHLAVTVKVLFFHVTLKGPIKLQIDFIIIDKFRVLHSPLGVKTWENHHFWVSSRPGRDETTCSNRNSCQGSQNS